MKQARSATPTNPNVYVTGSVGMTPTSADLISRVRAQGGRAPCGRAHSSPTIRPGRFSCSFFSGLSHFMAAVHTFGKLSGYDSWLTREPKIAPAPILLPNALAVDVAPAFRGPTIVVVGSHKDAVAK
jgi:hypothetical protein